MRKEQMIEKVQAIAKRVDESFCMHIDSLWLFGSGLYKENPKDIDLMVVFHTTPEDEAKWQKYYHEQVIQLPFCDHYYHSAEYKTGVILKRGLKNADIHFTTNIERASMKTSCFIFVWSRSCPNIKENLLKAGYDTILVKRIGEEISSLRSQLKEKGEESEVLERVVYAIIGNFNFLSMKQKLYVTMNVLARLPKRLVKEERIRAILRQYGFPESDITADRRKGSRVWWGFSDEAKKHIYDKP